MVVEKYKVKIIYLKNKFFLKTHLCSSTVSERVWGECAEPPLALYGHGVKGRGWGEMQPSCRTSFGTLPNEDFTLDQDEAQKGLGLGNCVSGALGTSPKRPCGGRFRRQVWE